MKHLAKELAKPPNRLAPIGIPIHFFQGLLWALSGPVSQVERLLDLPAIFGTQLLATAQPHSIQRYDVVLSRANRIRWHMHTYACSPLKNSLSTDPTELVHSGITSKNNTLFKGSVTSN